ITSTDGDPVIAAEIPADAAGGYDTKGLGNHIFGYNDSIEWWFSEWWGSPGLSVTFEVPVTSFSILIAELYPDAGSGNDPVAAHVFDSSGNTIFSDEIGANYNGTFDERVDLGPMDYPITSAQYHYVRYTYSADSIGGFIIGGDSEPTHLDRLEFTVPEPSSALLLLTGLVISGFSLSKKKYANA
ncbi:MAG: PEP-CTERM sorting domain-containing protein, partial [Candidatus Thiodiazotropha sp.]